MAATAFCLTLPLMPPTSAFVCNFTDCQALVKFKADIISDPKGYLQDWNEANPYYNWTGITGHQSLRSRVIDLELIDLGLQGKLTRLELAVNYFTGKIPGELGALTKLEVLYLHRNCLEGAIPASLSNCTALRRISLIVNRMSGELPAEMGNKLQNLQKVLFRDDAISGRIPVTFSNLSQTTLLDLSFNNLEGEVPEELGKLKNPGHRPSISLITRELQACNILGKKWDLKDLERMLKPEAYHYDNV
ncbi:unnamed protein product [Dovyalis caffra]|uniref:Leucine-rich repeat-containing N-terminal plant-type domain-containing protein n=1 Tax=Dovyalis caffra TaxID=77055 RepID=A0AAV1RWG0_9ROSI|nr:unnamed protein product [Dovyalis caffra]